MEVNKINDDMVKKLLMCDKSGLKNDDSEVEGPNFFQIQKLATSIKGNSFFFLILTLFKKIMELRKNF